MPAKKKSRKKSPASVASRTVSALKDNLSGAVKELRSVDATVGKRIRRLAGERRAAAKEAVNAVAGLRKTIENERRAALKRIDSALKAVQDRVRREGKNASRLAEDAVRRALSALNIPSRREIIDLTRKVDELSRRIASQKRR